MPEVGWCDNCNVPILDAQNCGICNSHSRRLRFPKAELKPIFEKEKELYKKVLAKNGFSSCDIFPKGTCFYNIMGEVIIDGGKVFRVSYDGSAEDWRIKFFKDFSNSIPPFRGSNLKNVIRANKDILEDKEREAMSYLRRTVTRFAHLPLAVAFSGGKDSAVTLALTRMIKREVDVIFLNTTIEFEETVKYVREITKLWKANLIEAKPPQDFFDLCRELGPPSTKMKWCCKTQKFSPQNQLINERYPKGVLVASGIRKKESNIRSGFRRIQRNKMIPKQTLVFPILNWSSLDVWLYLFWKHIPYNSIYDYGFARIGCWACPEKSLRDLKLVEIAHPGSIKRLDRILRNYAKQTRIPRPATWVRSGKWRFRKTKWSKTVVCTSSQLCSIDNQTVYSFANAHDANQVREFVKIFGKTTRTGALTRVTSSNMEITIVGGKMRTKIQNPQIIPIFEKQLARALNCVACGACVGICGSNALRIDSGEIKIGDNCTHCLRCVTSNGIRMSCVSVNYKPHVLSVK